MKYLLLFAIVFSNYFSIFGQVEIGDPIAGVESFDGAGEFISVSENGLRIAVSFGGQGNFGQIRVYENINGDWTPLGEFIEGNENFDNIGNYPFTMSPDGQRLAIASRENSQFHVHIYDFFSGGWNLVSEVIDSFDLSTSLDVMKFSSDGLSLVIGQPSFRDVDNPAGRRGAVAVYKEEANVWNRQGERILGEGLPDEFGSSVDISSDGLTIVGGAPENDNFVVNSQGSTRVFRYINNSWVQIGDDIDGEAPGDKSGRSVSMSLDGSRIAIGAHRNNAGIGATTGQVRVYENQNEEWVQLGSDVDGEESFSRFGWSVSLRELMR